MRGADAGLRAVVVERDESFAARRQGYGLTMQQGGTAMRDLGVDLGGLHSRSPLTRSCLTFKFRLHSSAIH